MFSKILEIKGNLSRVISIGINVVKGFSICRVWKYMVLNVMPQQEQLQNGEQVSCL